MLCDEIGNIGRIDNRRLGLDGHGGRQHPHASQLQPGPRPNDRVTHASAANDEGDQVEGIATVEFTEADVVRHPAFAQDELDRLRQQKLDALTVSLGEPSTLADLVMSKVVFGAGPYGHPADGAPASLSCSVKPRQRG